MKKGQSEKEGRIVGLAGVNGKRFQAHKDTETTILLGKMLLVVTLLAVDPDTHRGICEEGRLPRGGVNEQVFSLQLVGQNQSI